LEISILSAFELEEKRGATDVHKFPLLYIPTLPLLSPSLSLLSLPYFPLKTCAMKLQIPKGNWKPVLKRQNESCSVSRNFQRGALFKTSTDTPAPTPTLLIHTITFRLKVHLRTLSPQRFLGDR